MCEATCKSYKQIGLFACEGCAGDVERGPLPGINCEEVKPIKYNDEKGDDYI